VKRYFLFAAVALASAPAAAQDVDCDNPQTQTEMTICAGQDYQKADTELNAVWTKAIAIARESDNLGDAGDGRPGYEETLRKAERAWIAFRDANCDYEGFSARGGSMEPMLVNQCLARLTRDRTRQLRDLIQQMGTQ